MWWSDKERLTDSQLLEALGFFENEWAKTHIGMIREFLFTFKARLINGIDDSGSGNPILIAVLCQKGLLKKGIIYLNLELESEFWNRL